MAIPKKQTIALEDSSPDQRTISADLLWRDFKNNLAYYFSEALECQYAWPRWVFISLSHKCTYACKMCEVVKILKNHELATEKVKECIDSIAGWDNDSMVTITGGEAFLRKDIFEIFDYAVAKEVPIEVVSNGACIGQETANKIIRSGINNIAISLDGAAAHTHDFIRQKGSFQKAIDALRYLSEAKKQAGCGPQISVWTTIMKENVSELFDVIELVKGLGVECLVYHPVIVAQDDMQNTSAASPFWLGDEKTLNILKQQIDKIIQHETRDGIVAFLHDPYLWLDYFKGTLKKKHWKCNPFVFINIGPDAQVRSCGSAFGDVKELNLNECLKTAQADQARKLMKACPKPCLQTCWAHPQSDSLEKIINNFISEIGRADIPSRQKKEFIAQALEEVQRYELLAQEAGSALRLADG